MKIRLKGNSIRMRVTRSELKRLVEQGRIEEISQLGLGAENRLVFALEHKGTVGVATLRRLADEILVLLPTEDVVAWQDTEQVGIEAQQDIGGGAMLTILVEKDFMCLEGRTQEDDAFVNPIMSKC